MQPQSQQTQQQHNYLPFMPESIPAELRERKQWVCFKLTWDDVDQKYKKIPKSSFTHECKRHADKNCKNCDCEAKTACAMHTRHDDCASSTDPLTWTSFEDVVTSGCDAIGYAFSADDPYAGIDQDGVRDFINGMIEAPALKIAESLNSYTEASISGTGIHTIVKAKLPEAFTDPFEMYDRKRFFIFTGIHIPDFPTTIESRQDELDALIKEHFQQHQSKSKGNGHDTSGFWRGDIPLEAVMIRSATKFTNGECLECHKRQS